MSVITLEAKIKYLRCQYAYYLSEVRGIALKKNKLTSIEKMNAVWRDHFRHIIYDSHSFMNKQKECCQEYGLTDYETAKIFNLVKAYQELQISIPSYKIKGLDVDYEFGDDSYKGIGTCHIDCEDHFYHVELVNYPKNYNDVFHITFPVGTFFLANPKFEYCIVYITKKPDLKVKVEKYQGRDTFEDVEAYQDRLYKNIMRQPKSYFIGYNGRKFAYGMKFYRDEFNLDEIAATYKNVYQDIIRKTDSSSIGWCRNYESCYTNKRCEFYNICSTGVISKTYYKKKSSGEATSKGSR